MVVGILANPMQDGLGRGRSFTGLVSGLISRVDFYEVDDPIFVIQILMLADALTLQLKLQSEGHLFGGRAGVDINGEVRADDVRAHCSEDRNIFDGPGDSCLANFLETGFQGLNRSSWSRRRHLDAELVA